jgi:DNA recombination protein RmuC
MKQFISANQLIGQQADKLANALRGDGQKRGRWGELVLERILESSGLHKGRDFVSHGEALKLRNDDGGIQRPDAIVYLPDNKHIIVDSKVTLVSYERHAECDDPEERKPKKVMPKINVAGEEVEAMAEDADELPGSATSDALPAA